MKRINNIGGDRVIDRPREAGALPLGTTASPPAGRGSGIPGRQEKATVAINLEIKRLKAELGQVAGQLNPESVA